MIEMNARVVDDQSHVARSLGEQKTPGFTIWNLRTYYRPAPSWMLTAGVENLTNKFYREHLDYRSGRGVFQPGINFHFGSELTW